MQVSRDACLVPRLILPLVLLVALPVGAADPVAERPGDLEIAPYDQPIVQRALEAQAWVVLTAASDFARANDGVYPSTVAAFQAYLPHGVAMENLSTVRKTPTEDDAIEAGRVLYVPLVWNDHVVGAEVVAAGWQDHRVTLVSDLGWWERVRSDEVIAAR